LKWCINMYKYRALCWCIIKGNWRLGLFTEVYLFTNHHNTSTDVYLYSCYRVISITICRRPLKLISNYKNITWHHAWEDYCIQQPLILRCLYLCFKMNLPRTIYHIFRHCISVKITFLVIQTRTGTRAECKCMHVVIERL